MEIPLSLQLLSYKSRYLGKGYIVYIIEHYSKMKFAAAALVLFTVFCCLECGFGYPPQRERQRGKFYDRL